jgi:hypothetical protein
MGTFHDLALRISVHSSQLGAQLAGLPRQTPGTRGRKRGKLARRMMSHDRLSPSSAPSCQGTP